MEKSGTEILTKSGQSHKQYDCSIGLDLAGHMTVEWCSPRYHTFAHIFIVSLSAGPHY